MTERTQGTNTSKLFTTTETPVHWELFGSLGDANAAQELSADIDHWNGIEEVDAWGYARRQP